MARRSNPATIDAVAHLAAPLHNTLANGAARIEQTARAVAASMQPVTTNPVAMLERQTIKLRDLHIPHGSAATKRDRLPGMIRLGDSTHLRASRRFYTSLLARFGIGDSVFQYFSPAELFERVVDVRGDNNLRCTIQHDPEGGTPKLLAVASETAQLPDLAHMQQLFADHKGVGLQYVDGVLSARFEPRSEHQALIGPDEFRNRFALEVPMDGYGKPSTYLEMYRLICANGAIGRSTAFRQSVNPGKDQNHTLARVLNTFDSTGFEEFRNRFLAAQRSPASVRECQLLRRMMTKYPVGLHLLRKHRFDQLVGDFGSMYGLSSANQVSAKRQALMPANCRVYDLINFCSELATHFASGPEAMAYHAFIGQLLSVDFDMEGVAPEQDSFAQFVIPEREKLILESSEIVELARKMDAEFTAHGHVLVDVEDVEPVAA